MCKVQFTVYSVSSICVSPGLKRCLSIEAVNIKHNTKQGLSIVRDLTFSKDNIHYLYLSFSSFHPSPPPSVPPLPPIPLLLIFPSLPASFRPSSSSHTSPSHLSIPPRLLPPLLILPYLSSHLFLPSLLVLLLIHHSPIRPLSPSLRPDPSPTLYTPTPTPSLHTE